MIFGTLCKRCILFLLCFFALSTLCADDEYWVIAVSEFESNIEDDATAILIPKIILQNIPTQSTRTISRHEQLHLAKRKHEDEIRVLYNDLQKKIMARDALIFTDGDSVLEERVSLDDDIAKLNESIEIKKEEISVIVSDNFSPVERKIQIWKNSTDNLYENPANNDFFYPKDINALITGKITHIDSFIKIDVYLHTYPGGIQAYHYTDGERLSSIEVITNRIVENLMLPIVNKDAITINFSISPPEAVKDARLTVNGMPLYYTDDSDYFASLDLTSGLYDIYISSSGYENFSISHFFTGQSDYLVDINLQKEKKYLVPYSIPSENGALFVNAQNSLKKKNEEFSSFTNTTEGYVTVNGFPALGEFVNEAGVSSLFLLQLDDGFSLSENITNTVFSFMPDEKNYTDIIEKKRKIMYHSYSALITSLPLFFIANGQYINEYNAWQSNNSSGKNVKAWEIAKYTTMGISIGLGINTIVQLALYIHSVNSILPEEILLESK